MFHAIFPDNFHIELGLISFIQLLAYVEASFIAWQGFIETIVVFQCSVFVLSVIVYICKNVENYDVSIITAWDISPYTILRMFIGVVVV